MPIVGPTNYVHPYPNYQLNDLHQAMDYNASGEPIIRTSGGITSIINIAAGQVTGMSAIFKHGYNATFANGVEESYWPGSVIYPWSAWATPGTLSVVSSAGGDTGSLVITGLDASFAVVQETVTMTGTTPAITTNTFARINDLTYSNGSSANAGNISVSRNGTVVGYISTGFGSGQMAQYTVPAGYTAYVMQGSANIGKGNDGTGYFKYRLYGSAFQYAFVFLLYQSVFNYTFTTPLMLPEKTDLDVSLLAANANTASSCAYDIILVQNQT